MNRYGPPELASQSRSDYLYADTLSGWTGWQRQFQMTWDRILGIEIKNAFTVRFGGQSGFWEARAPWAAVAAKGEFQLSGRGLFFLAENHYTALVIKLLAVSAERKLRKCGKPDCDALPYFVAEHGKTQYCSPKCAEWAQRKSKRQYWRDKRQGQSEHSNPSHESELN